MADNCFVYFPILRLDHPDEVFMNIKEIMTMIIKESDDIPMQLLNTLVSILISSVKKENQVLHFLYKFIYLYIFLIVFNDVLFWFRMFHLVPICWEREFFKKVLSNFIHIFQKQWGPSAFPLTTTRKLLNWFGLRHLKVKLRWVYLIIKVIAAIICKEHDCLVV